MSKSGVRPTVHDVARVAGVSSATASRVLSRSDYPVSEEKRARILKTAEELGYRPNMIGRMLKNSAARDIGIIVPNISNPFYTELVLGAETAAKERGFGLFLCNSLRSEAREREYLETLCQKQVCGIILSSVSQSQDFLRDLAQRYVLSVVTLDQSVCDTFSHVNFKTRLGAYEAVNYLIQNGHRRIALFTSPPTLFSRREVLSGYRKGLIDARLPFDNSFVFSSTSESELFRGEVYEFENGKHLTDRMLASGPLPDAVLCVNDMTAAGALQRLSECGIAVPDQLSVMGMDNISLARMLSPALTTVDQAPFEAGFSATCALLDSLSNPETPPEPVVITPRIVTRQSVRSR